MGTGTGTGCCGEGTCLGLLPWLSAVVSPPDFSLFSYNNGVVMTSCRELDSNRSALSAASAFAIATAGANEGTPTKEKYRRMSLASAGTRPRAAPLRGQAPWVPISVVSGRFPPGALWLWGRQCERPDLLYPQLAACTAPGTPCPAAQSLAGSCIFTVLRELGLCLLALLKIALSNPGQSCGCAKWWAILSGFPTDQRNGDKEFVIRRAATNRVLNVLRHWVSKHSQVQCGGAGMGTGGVPRSGGSHVARGWGSSGALVHSLGSLGAGTGPAACLWAQPGSSWKGNLPFFFF